MRPRSIEFVTAQVNALAADLAIVTIWTLQGARVYAKVGLTDSEIWISALGRGDGTIKGDGTFQGGAQYLPVISREARLLSASPIQVEMGTLALGGVNISGTRRTPAVELHLRNDDDHFGKALASDVFLSAKVNITLGFRGMRRDKVMTLFQGIIQSHQVTREELVLSVEAA